MQLNQQFKVRKATLTDLEFVYQAIVAISDSKIALREFEILFKLKLKSAGFYVFLLEEHSRLVSNAGLLVAQLQQNLIDAWPTIEIQTLYIVPKYRKFGAADFLHSYIEHFSKKQNVSKLKVSCKINSTLNQNFYTTRGFKIFQKQYVKEVY